MVQITVESRDLPEWWHHHRPATPTPPPTCRCCPCTGRCHLRRIVKHPHVLALPGVSILPAPHANPIASSCPSVPPVLLSCVASAAATAITTTTDATTTAAAIFLRVRDRGNHVRAEHGAYAPNRRVQIGIAERVVCGEVDGGSRVAPDEARGKQASRAPFSSAVLPPVAPPHADPDPGLPPAEVDAHSAVAVTS